MNFSLLLDPKFHEGRDSVYLVHNQSSLNVRWVNEWGSERFFCLFPHLGKTLSSWGWGGGPLTEMYVALCCLPLLALCTYGSLYLQNSSLFPLTLASASASSVPACFSPLMQSNHPSNWQILSLAIIMPSVWWLWILNVQEPILSFYDNLRVSTLIRYGLTYSWTLRNSLHLPTLRECLIVVPVSWPMICISRTP